MLNKRFGPLPDWENEKLQQASREQLDGWAERIFDVESLEQFFAGLQKRRTLLTKLA